ncbi:MAG: EipB family protein [Pseudomonadota bacterium]
MFLVNHSLARALAAALVATLSSGPAVAQLVPHRALYELSLAESGGGLAQAEGAFAIEWQAACEGYSSRQRLWFLGATDEGGLFDSDVRFSSWESLDTTTLRFTMRSFSEGELVEEYRGTAIVPRDGTPGRAHYVLPEASEAPLPPDTLFPTDHLNQLLASAMRGERLMTQHVFDGSGAGADALSAVTAVIGQPAVEGEQEDEERVWPVALGYHDPQDHEAGVPIFELRFMLSERGLMRDVLLDYGDFALKATLEHMAWLPEPDCP